MTVTDFALKTYGQDMSNWPEWMVIARAEAYAAAQLRRYADHDLSCPEFKQKANRHNKGLVEDSAWPCNCGLAEILK
jgi:hypothetical protein